MKKLALIIFLIFPFILMGCSSEEATTNEVKGQYTMGEVNGKAVEVLQGLYALEIDRENIPEATKGSQVTVEVEGEEIKLAYHEERDSFRNSKIQDVELEDLEQGTIKVSR